ncbi:MAG: hypothetical protein IKW96_11875 [Ruminococcus sp.]|uniref:hypothetical protein n=1 Tax=Ruminococcus sp. TaxID=41978 RepID=UPI0025FED7A2|nr:hypothetical protein [Ruminococcus sp.]MBR5683952.1 hypothetical protein [Ruminococcus sp.]
MKKAGSALTVFITIVALIVGLFLFDSFVANTSSQNLYKGFSDDDISKSGIIDEHGLFAGDQSLLWSLNDEIQECARKNNMNILVFLPDSSRSHYTDDMVCNFTTNELNSVFGENTDGILYYLDISGKSPASDDIATSARTNLIFTDSICDSIFSLLDSYLPSSSSSEPLDPKKIGEAISKFCYYVDYYNTSTPRESYFHEPTADPPVYVYMKNGETFVTKSAPPSKKWVVLIISELIGALVTLIIYLVSKHNYKFKSKTNPRIYLASDAINLTQNADIFQGTHTTKTRIESSSGGSRGGGFHGGGGHHGGSVGHHVHHR